MSSSYEPPETREVSHDSPAPSIDRVILHQKQLLSALIGIVAISFLSSQPIPNEMTGSVIAAGISLLVFMTVAMFRLAMDFHSAGTSLLLTAAAVVPIVGVIAMIRTSGRASTYLKEHGVDVGLLGAR